MSTVKKRFIAGAVCPKCAAMDKIVTFNQDEKEFRECVSCGYLDEMRFQSGSRELETRVNVSEEEKKSETQVINIVSLFEVNDIDKKDI